MSGDGNVNRVHDPRAGRGYRSDASRKFLRAKPLALMAMMSHGALWVALSRPIIYNRIVEYCKE
jgi:hypothetical protein